jgi:hypothetical protein
MAPFTQPFSSPEFGSQSSAIIPAINTSPECPLPRQSLEKHGSRALQTLLSLPKPRVHQRRRLANRCHIAGVRPVIDHALQLWDLVWLEHLVRLDRCPDVDEGLGASFDTVSRVVIQLGEMFRGLWFWGIFASENTLVY